VEEIYDVRGFELRNELKFKKSEGKSSGWVLRCLKRNVIGIVESLLKFKSSFFSSCEREHAWRLVIFGK
jgi:hypothetical protein